MLAAFVILASIVGLYVVLVLLMARVAARPSQPPASRMGPLPRVAVLVAARNEEACLGRCLDALMAQDYPADRLTLYVADDHSTDGTAALIRRYQDQARPVIEAGIEANSFPALPDEEMGAVAVRYVRVPDPVGHLRGKANAIHTAIEASDEDLVLITDADCTPPPGWARAHVAYLQDDAVGMVCGHTYVEHRTPLETLQALDWSFLLASASALAAFGLPITAMGNNMAFRRAAYEAVGGYPALPFSVTEDYVLFKTVADRSGFRVRLPSDPDLRNYTRPLSTLHGVFQQRRRWARGGLRARAWVYGLYVLGHLAHLLPLLALIVNPVLALSAIAVKVGADFVLLWVTLGLSKRRGLLRAFPLFEAYLFFYMSVLPAVLILFPRLHWKDRKL